jgi:hypothetical protein
MGLRQDRGRLNHQCAVGASLTSQKRFRIVLRSLDHPQSLKP